MVASQPIAIKSLVKGIAGISTLFWNKMAEDVTKACTHKCSVVQYVYVPG